MKMRRTAVLFAGLLFIAAFMNFVPGSQSQEESTEWFEDYTINGSCSSNDNVEHRFWVNSTVVEIEINVSWPKGYGADINFWLEDSKGFHVDASESIANPDTLDIREFSDRGRWKLVIYPESCGSGTQVNYTANITVHHIARPALTISTSQTIEGENVTMNLSSPYESVIQYLFDFGDGTNSEWSQRFSHTKTYNESGNYTPRAKVRYNDGTESDWVEAGEIEVGTIEVAAEPEGPNMVLWMGFWLLLIGLLSFGLNLLYSKRKGI